MLNFHGVSFPQKVKNQKVYTEEYFQPTDAIRKIYSSKKLKTENGKIKKLTYAVDPYEGYFLYSVIKENNYKNILEIGMGNGMSALYICSALDLVKFKSKSKFKENSFSLTSIDPFQKVEWENTGLQTLKDANLEKYHTLIEDVDYLALPDLVNQVEEGKLEKFDLILINGNRLFDYTVLDFFFAIKLLNIGGMIIVDGIKQENSDSAYKYIKANYQNLLELKNGINYETQGSFVKIAEDNRPWFFHIDF
jgi:predicted O-methyltransferase YrrM